MGRACFSVPAPPRRGNGRLSTGLPIQPLFVLLLVYLLTACHGFAASRKPNWTTFEEFLKDKRSHENVFHTTGELCYDSHGWYLRIPRCPQCNKEHTHGYTGDIDRYGIYSTKRSPHCYIDKPMEYLCKEMRNPADTIIVVEKTSHFQWAMEVNPPDPDTGAFLSPCDPDDAPVEWECKWKGSSFIEVWEKDLNFCLGVIRNSRHKQLATPRTSRVGKNKAFFKEYLLDKLSGENSLVRLESVHIAGSDDYAGNMVQSSKLKSERRNPFSKKVYASHKHQWVAETGCRWPSTCCVKGCDGQPQLGAHIFRKGFDTGFIVPMCHSCNNQTGKDVFFINSSNEANFPFKLKQGTWCVEVEKVHISSQHPTLAEKRWRESFSALRKEKSPSYNSSPPQTVSDLGDTVLIWGQKRKGWTFSDVWNWDRDYCDWVLDDCKFPSKPRTPVHQNGLLFKQWIKKKTEIEYE